MSVQKMILVLTLPLIVTQGQKGMHTTDQTKASDFKQKQRLRVRILCAVCVHVWHVYFPACPAATELLPESTGR